MNVQQNFEMRWNALEVIDRRQVEGRDEALVNWACSWITRADHSSGHYGAVARLVQARTVNGVEWVLVMWSASWEPVDAVDEELLEDYVLAVDAVDAVGEKVESETASTAEGGEAAKPAKAGKRKRQRRRNW